jgi:hypothetical protein
MKRIELIVIGLIVVGLFLNSCDDVTKTETETQYYYEIFRLTKTNFNSVPLPSTLTFNAIKSYRNSLKNYSVEFIGSGTDATQNDIYSLLTQRGMTPSETNDEISLLNSVGNNVLIFEYAYSDSYYVIIYVEKL